MDLLLVLPWLCGTGFALAVVAAVVGIRGTPVRPPRTARPSVLALARRYSSRSVLGVLAGVVVWAVTGWPVAAVATTIGMIAIPKLLRNDEAQNVIARLDGLQSWTRRVADLLGSGAGGLERAITASVRTAPAALEREITDLAVRVRTRGVEPALRAFANDLADPAVDEVVMALIQRHRAGGRGLPAVLEAKATALSREVTARQNTEADRAKPRADVRALVWITVVLLALLVTVAHTYLQPFGSLLGQLVMAVVAVFFAVSFWWMYTLCRPRRGLRFLVNTRTQRRGGRS